ncbi:unnamed protein product [Periconia digitata]|uniref:BTB domain-containing protein n=1 Tax=Periconia digitata TaxID=1303443 RepID=A0A9W4UD63_9PLEO|nr:unnamed protein product [Periconia digitata]
MSWYPLSCSPQWQDSNPTVSLDVTPSNSTDGMLGASSTRINFSDSTSTMSAQSPARRPSFGSTGMSPTPIRNRPTSWFSSSRSVTPLRSRRAPSTISRSPSHTTKLLNGISGMFNNMEYSDATIMIQNTILPVHKMIICSHSSYFKKAFDGSFIEGTTDTIKFNEGSAAAHWRVFEFIYTDDHHMMKDAQVYILADMFLLEDLKTLSLEKLKYKFHCDPVDHAFPVCIRKVYAGTSDRHTELRSAFVQKAIANARGLRSNESFMELFREGGDFPVDYVHALSR